MSSLVYFTACLMSQAEIYRILHFREISCTASSGDGTMGAFCVEVRREMVPNLPFKKDGKYWIYILM